MDRQWQRKGRGRYETLPSQQDFVQQLPPLTVPPSTASAGMGASLGDLYAIYSALHAQCRAPEVRVSAAGSFYYLLASLPQEALLGGKAAVRQLEAAQRRGLAAQPPVDVHAIREAVVPVSAKASGVTLQRLQALFPHIQEGGDGHLLLAVVDGSGAVSLMRLFNYVQPPFEGPEALPQQVARQPGQQEGQEGEAEEDVHAVLDDDGD